MWWQRAFIVGEIGSCFQCGKPTRFIEVNFETHMHPGVCEDKTWSQYVRAVEEIS